MLTLTCRPPLTLKALIKQRVRWNLGYIETIDKEYKYYWEQIKAMSPIGVVSVLDILLVLLNISLPLVFVFTEFSSINALLVLLAGMYLIGIISCTYVIMKSPKEFIEIRKNLVFSVLIYPMFKVWIGYFPWVRAIQVFIKKNKSRYFSIVKERLYIPTLHR